MQKQANFTMHMGSSLFTSLCPGCLVVSLHNPTVLNLGGMMALLENNGLENEDLPPIKQGRK